MTIRLQLASGCASNAIGRRMSDQSGAQNFGKDQAISEKQRSKENRGRMKELSGYESRVRVRRTKGAMEDQKNGDTWKDR